MFDSYEQIEPLLERPYDDKSVTLDLAKELATRLQCAVIAGFPEAATERALAEQDMPSKSMHDARLPREAMGEASYLPRVSRKAYNAALLVNNDGSLVKVFRKHFLYEADTTWSDEGTCFRARAYTGTGFQYVDLPDIGRLCVAVCMDLNRTCGMRS